MGGKNNRKYFGVGVSPGIALAQAVVYRPNTIDPPIYQIEKHDSEAEWERLIHAKDVTRRQLRDIRDSLGLETPGGEAGIIDAHMMVLDDELIVEDMRCEIFEKLHNCEWAVRDVANKYIAKFNEFDDIYFVERAGDIADVSRRLLRALMGISGDLDFDWQEPRIVVAENLTPSEVLALPRNAVCGLVLDRGSMTSHAALLVRAVEIPAVFGLGNFSSSITPGAMLGIDGAKGVVVVNPSDEDAVAIRGNALERDALLSQFKADSCEVATTPDGFTVRCLANIENQRELPYVDANGAEGVGLFRTEYLWMAEGRPVDEEEQTRTYAAIAQAMGDRPFVVRVFDLGGDKFVGNQGLNDNETNPFLGLRSIRFLLQNEDLFKVQIRAILRAGAEVQKQIYILIPMISELYEVVRSRRIIEECFLELKEKGLGNCIFPKIGIMIEVPSAAIASPLLASHVDFFSIGTNDLTQYTFAADRINDSVAYLYQPLHPSVLKLISMTVEAATRAGIGLSVCGEMAGNPLHVIILLGLRVPVLSMASSSIPMIKALIRKIPVEEAARVSEMALNSATMAQVRHLVRNLLEQYAPEILRLC
jgi:phosphotransferase system enzyme I (PtsI)